MLEFQEYSTAWLMYFAAVIGLLLVTWRLLLNLSLRYLRGVLFITVAVFLVTPVLDNTSYWTPAWIMASLEFLFSGIDKVMPVLRIMLIIWCVAIAAYSVVFLLFLRGKKVAVKTSNDVSKNTNKKNKIPRRETPTVS